MKLIYLLIAAVPARACPRERSLHSTLSHVVGRQTSSAPVLDTNEQLLVDSFDNSSIATWSYYYTHGAHLAGKNKTVAQWTADRWAEFGFTSRLDEYYVLLDYPVSHSLILTYPNGSTFTPSLKEEALAVDETTSYPNSIPSFNGYSFTGNASAEYVYVGRGQQVDFERLLDLGVELKGKIALAKYGGPFRGLKVKNSQEYGLIGIVIFTDPGDDGNITEAKGVSAYPNGPARNPTAVQRGSVLFLSIFQGDPTTPGYPSKQDSPRADRGNLVPHIPSLPISWLDAQPILQALNGYGTNGSDVNRTGWVGEIPGVSYSTGQGAGATLTLSNVMEDTYSTIWDAIGIINGTNQDEVVIVGNHRDAWIVGGAADPNSGSAVLVELAKAFGKLTETGWKPTRTIVLASWDAEEYGSIGSTEWVEEYVPWLKAAAVSYFNIDVAVSGPIPVLDATPDLHNISLEIMKKIAWPYRGATDLTMYDVWKQETGEIGVLGSGSDFTSFLQSGIASLDVGSINGPDDPVYHYHSNYDSYHWMTTFGDPEFIHHKAIGQYLTLLLYHFSSDAALPLQPADYVPELNTYLTDLEEVIASANGTLDLSELTATIGTFEASAEQYNALRDFAISTSDADLLTVTNQKARDFSRGFTSQGGLPGREFFQNLLFAPGLDTGYAPVTYPAITESITFTNNFTQAQEFVGKTANAILLAANILKT
ncbi:N-acetylated-alpha-linked acidic dipeptidase-like protein 2 [Lophiostoma macrostomum CBS 122681]|uniref:N-acetylated-alpha-linked acidic dipeptidase-like protein 2 n=1 Tax=Lophiostoma macrostomum CBS 122681 TaxID=1314788 RepID=A0A6A6SQ07_9PLEO|nr:N-acetylated-alpha-linked acidic dipeptidase-like protein 2 [Lophiostoma macrostomum CBS 122681]